MKKNILSSLGFYFLHKKHLALWVAFLSALLLVSSFIAYQNFSHLSDLRKQLSLLQNKALKTLDKRKEKDLFLDRHILADPHYLENQIEALSFIQKELSLLKALSNHPAYKYTTKVQKNYTALSQKNPLQFSEDNIQTTSSIQEMQEVQNSTAYMNLLDLETLLCLLEGVSIGNLTPSKKQPQFIICDFHVRKTPLFSNNEIFCVKMKLLKREFLKPRSES